MDFIPQECAARSVGAANQLTTLLLQSLLVSYCNISAPNNWPEDYGPVAVHYGLNAYDFVVVGAGSAGSVVASRLSENPNARVLLIEAGEDPPIESQVPVMYVEMTNTTYDWEYYLESNGKSCMGMMKPGQCYWPRGKMLGGSGGMNGMIHIRGHPQNYDTWRDLGNPTWDWESVLPYFERSIKHGAVYDGLLNQGLLPTEEFSNKRSSIKQIIIDAVQEIGVPYNGAIKDAYVGYGQINGTIENGQRASTGKTFLGVAKDRKNFHVVKKSMVKKINFNSAKEVKSVTFVYDSSYEVEVAVKKEVIVSAGAVESPKLLMLSGIGPNEQLKTFEIPVIKDLSVGENLVDHVGVGLLFQLKNSGLPVADMLDLLDADYTYLTRWRGAFVDQGVTDLLGFINIPDNSSCFPNVGMHHFLLPKALPNLQVFLKAIGYGDSINKQFTEANAKNDLLFVIIGLLQPKSRGKIELRSNDFNDSPKIFGNYLENVEDIDLMVKALEYQIGFLKTKSFKNAGADLVKINISECDRFEHLSSEYLKCYSKYMTLTVYHPTSSVKMGPDSDKSSVVDWRLRVKGVKGLRVVDASVMPMPISANTNAAAIMIAEKAVDFIREDNRV